MSFGCNSSGMDPKQLDEYWLNLVLGMIGETIDKGDEITGARVVDKSKRDVIYRMELWFRKKDMTVGHCFNSVCATILILLHI